MTETSLPSTLPPDARVIAVTSGRGGVGTTSLVANLALAMLHAGERVVVIDAEVGLRNLDTALGLDQHRAPAAPLHHPRWPGLAFLRADAEDLDAHVRAQRTAGARVLIDAPRAGAAGFSEAVRASDAVLVVLTPDANCLRDTEDALTALAEAGAPDAWLVVSRWRDGTRPARAEALTLAQVRAALATPVLGVVPDDPRVVEGHNAGEPVVAAGDGSAARAFATIAQRALGNPAEDAPTHADAAWYDVRRWIGLGA